MGKYIGSVVCFLSVLVCIFIFYSNQDYIVRALAASVCFNFYLFIEVLISVKKSPN